jgi:hypothetical protein
MAGSCGLALNAEAKNPKNVVASSSFPSKEVVELSEEEGGELVQLFSVSVAAAVVSSTESVLTWATQEGRTASERR